MPGREAIEGEAGGRTARQIGAPPAESGSSAREAVLNKWKPGPRGWLKGKISGEEAFSDGCGMFIGTRKGAEPIKSKVKDPFKWALQKMLLKRLQPTRLERFEQIGPEPYQLHCAVLRGGVYIQEIYWRHACTFKDVQFFLGRNTGGKNDRAVICKVGKKIVGAIMPVRAPQ